MERTDVAPREAEVPMVEQEVVRQMRVLKKAGWGAKRIAHELGIARNKVLRYLRRARAAATSRLACVLLRPYAACNPSGQSVLQDHSGMALYVG